jgi:hypothetical protein
MKQCKKCKGTRFIKVSRLTPITKEKYYTSKCRDCANSYAKKTKVVSKWQQNNKELIREYQRDYYSKDNRYRVKNALNSKRLKQRTFGDKSSIAEFYRNTPKGFEVDHIIPLNGKKVSGLHTRPNLEYLTTHANRIKSNKF